MLTRTAGALYVGYVFFLVLVFNTCSATMGTKTEITNRFMTPPPHPCNQAVEYHRHPYVFNVFKTIVYVQPMGTLQGL